MHSFVEKYRLIFSSNIDNFLQSLKLPKEKFFRLNKARNFNYLNEFEYLNIPFSRCDLFNNVYKLIESDKNIRLSDTISFFTGGIYIQNPSSLLPVKFLIENIDVDEPVILDMASAPGGKTTALSEFLGRRGLIVANEPSKSRLKDLNFNIEKNYAYNVATVSYDGRVLHKYLSEVFDAVLLDAPCSNENKIFHDNTVLNNWSETLVERLAKLQRELIESAYFTLKKGGILIYSTCTFSIEENEQIVEHLLSEYDVELIDLNKGDFDYGLSGNSSIDKKVVRILPHLGRYPGFDGFFVAGFRKKGGGISNRNIKILNSGYGLQKPAEDSIIYEIKNDLYLSSKYQISGLKYEKFGTKLGKKIKNMVEYSSQACWEFGDKLINKKLVIDDYEKANKFVKGEDLKVKNYGYKEGVLFFKDIPLGYFKLVGGKIKNKIDRYFLRGLK